MAEGLREARSGSIILYDESGLSHRGMSFAKPEILDNFEGRGVSSFETLVNYLRAPPPPRLLPETSEYIFSRSDVKISRKRNTFARLRRKRYYDDVRADVEQKVAVRCAILIIIISHCLV